MVRITLLLVSAAAVFIQVQASETTNRRSEIPALTPATAATSSDSSTKKAKGEIAAGGQIAFGANTTAKGGFKADGEITKFNATNAADVGVGSGAVTGPVDGWKAKGKIGAGGYVHGAWGKLDDGIKASGEISSFKGVNSDGRAVSGKNAKGQIAAGGEITTKSVKAKGGFKASGELSSLTGVTPPPTTGESLTSAPSSDDVLAVHGIDTSFGQNKYYLRSL